MFTATIHNHGPRLFCPCNIVLLHIASLTRHHADSFGPCGCRLQMYVVIGQLAFGTSATILVLFVALSRFNANLLFMFFRT